MTAVVRFTHTQLEEIQHKINIMIDDGCDGETIAASYGLTDETLAALDRKIFTVVGKLTAKVELNEMEATAIEGELENAWDIASSNVVDTGDEYDVFAARIKDGRKRIRAAFPNLFKGAL